MTATTADSNLIVIVHADAKEEYTFANLRVPDEAMRQPPPQRPATAKRPAAKRNDPCPCGSGKKYKRCCQS